MFGQDNRGTDLYDNEDRQAKVAAEIAYARAMDIVKAHRVASDTEPVADEVEFLSDDIVVESVEHDDLSPGERFFKTMIEAYKFLDDIEIESARRMLDNMIAERKARVDSEQKNVSVDPVVDRSAELIRLAREVLSEDYGVPSMDDSVSSVSDSVEVEIDSIGEVVDSEDYLGDKAVVETNTVSDMTPSERLIQAQIDYDEAMNQLNADFNQRMLDRMIAERKSEEAEQKRMAETSKVDYAAELIKIMSDLNNEDCEVLDVSEEPSKKSL